MRRKYREAEDTFYVKGYAALADFNAERARGLVHTPEYVERMAEVQARFDVEYRAPIGALKGVSSGSSGGGER